MAELTIGGEQRERLVVTVLGGGNRLAFTFEQLDQSHIPGMLRQLREIERELPLRGELAS